MSVGSTVSIVCTPKEVTVVIEVVVLLVLVAAVP